VRPATGEESGYLGAESAFRTGLMPRARPFPILSSRKGGYSELRRCRVASEDPGPWESRRRLHWTIDVGGVSHVFSGDIVLHQNAHVLRDDTPPELASGRLDECIGEYVQPRRLTHTGHGQRPWASRLFYWQKGYHFRLS